MGRRSILFAECLDSFHFQRRFGQDAKIIGQPLPYIVIKRIGFIEVGLATFISVGIVEL